MSIVKLLLKSLQEIVYCWVINVNVDLISSYFLVLKNVERGALEIDFYYS